MSICHDQRELLWAVKFLTDAGHQVLRVADVQFDAILWIDCAQDPMVAWLRPGANGDTEARCEPGWPAVPSPGIWADEDDYEDYEPGEGAGTQ
ncbi:MAG TPA: hypothetical protein VN803_08480 [Gemmatimonadales bacterium]|nr:hypothetical protein [Gemmatimonadales bacterium]